MKKLKVGIIGLGVGEAHMEGYLKHPSCEVKTVCDLSKEKLEKVKKKHPSIYLTHNDKELLEDPEIDVISIASYDNDHANQVQMALFNNKHVFVEKPLCQNISQLHEIYSIYKTKKNLKLSTNVILRQSPRFRFLKEEVEKGHFGNLYYLEGDYNYGRLEKLTHGWRGEIKDYSVVLGGAIHLIDLILWLTQEKVVEVCAFGNKVASYNSQFQYDDCVVALIKFENIIAKVSANFGCIMPHYHGFNIYGTKASFFNDFKNARLYTSRDPSVTPQKIDISYPGVTKDGLIGNFVDSILFKKPCLVEMEDIIKCMLVCFAIEDAHKSGGVVKLLDLENKL